jgi:hypothetical protein
VQRGEPPVLLAAGGHVEVGQLERAVPLAPAVTGTGCRTVRVRLAAEPAGLRAEDLGGTDSTHSPFHLQLDERLSSRAYSIGSSLAIGSTKPRTIIAIASSSVRPAAHQVEELVVADLGDRRLVPMVTSSSRTSTYG